MGKAFLLASLFDRRHLFSCSSAGEFLPDLRQLGIWYLDLRPEHYGIAIGAFADPDFPPPSCLVWEESKHTWISLPDGIEHYRKARACLADPGLPRRTRGTSARPWPSFAILAL